MDNKFNAFSKAQEELDKTNTPNKNVNTSGILPKKKKETKEQMSIMLTPSHKKKLREMADSLNMSASELIAYWIDQGGE